MPPPVFRDQSYPGTAMLKSPGAHPSRARGLYPAAPCIIWIGKTLPTV